MPPVFGGGFSVFPILSIAVSLEDDETGETLAELRRGNEWPQMHLPFQQPAACAFPIDFNSSFFIFPFLIYQAMGTRGTEPFSPKFQWLYLL
jgi:hypothetical protein